MHARRFVLENSGVAEPQNIRDKFNEAIADGNPLMQRLHLDTLVTIVDAGTSCTQHLGSPHTCAGMHLSRCRAWQRLPSMCRKSYHRAIA